MGKKSKNKKQNENCQGDIMQSLMNESQFDNPTKKKKKKIKRKKKDIEVDFEYDDTDTILRKIVLSLQQIREDLEEIKSYSEGTYCTSTEHNRFASDIDRKVENLMTEVADLNV